MIQKKPIHAAPPHLQRMLLRLQKNDYNIIYKPGKDMVLADRLSRFPSRNENLPIELHHNIHHITFTQDKINIICSSTERDPILHTAYCLTLNGWATKFHEVPCIACQYWGTRDELSVESGLLIKGDRICIPPELYERMLYGDMEAIRNYLITKKTSQKEYHDKTHNAKPLTRSHPRSGSTLFKPCRPKPIHRRHSNSKSTTAKKLSTRIARQNILLNSATLMFLIKFNHSKTINA